MILHNGVVRREGGQTRWPRSHGLAHSHMGSGSRGVQILLDYDQIHAREAAGYMDLNYEFFRAGDTRGWIECLRAEAAAAQAKMARPD